MAEEIRTQLSGEQLEAELPPPSFSEKLKAKRGKILAGILGILVFAGAIFGAYKLGEKQAKPVSLPTPTPVVVATPTPDPTLNWKTYTNTKYGYLIKYPNEWQAFEVKKGPEAGIRTDFAESESLSDIEYWVWIKMNDNPDELSASQWVDRLLSQYSDQPAVIAGIKREEDRVASTEAERVTGLPAMTEMVSVFIPKEKSMYEIVLQKGIGTLSGESKDTFNLMLSTFRFLEEKAGVDCRTLEALEMRDLAQISKEDCQRCGGKWGHLSRDVDLTGCNPKTSDAGKTCTNYDQCIGTCLTGDMFSTSGTCSEYKYRLGCSLEFSEGEPVMICRD